MEAFGSIFSSAKFDPEWRLRQLTEALKVSPTSNPDHSVIETLSELASDFPPVAIECLTLLVEGSDAEWKVQYWGPHIRNAIASAVKKGENDRVSLLINKLVNKLAALGFVDFRDLLPKQ